MKRRVVVKIDLDALKRNYVKIARRTAPAAVLCVLKANAYGLGVGAYAKALVDAGCRSFGVADPEEALELVGILGTLGSNEVSVQILSSILPDEIEPMVAAGVTLPVVDFEAAALISAAAVKLGKIAKVHFKIDSGMGRLGIRAAEAVEVVEAVRRLPNLECEGIFSHCAMAYDVKDSFTDEQITVFKNLLAELESRGISFAKVHIAASDAVNNFPETARAPFTMVRTGINLHGSFDPNGIKALELESVLSLVTRVAQVRSLPAGSTIGYGRTWCLARPTKVAVISAGYADGLPLALTNKGFVFIGGKRCKILGRISMDYTSVDVTDVPDVKSGDEVICFGKCGDESITPDDWADIKGTHSYDIICSLGRRVCRSF